MKPAAICAGVSYSDYGQMTLGEIRAVLEYSHNRDISKSEREQQLAAFVAFWGGYYSRFNVKMPQNIAKAFPYIFGQDGNSDGINVNNPQAGAEALKAWADRFNANKGR